MYDASASRDEQALRLLAATELPAVKGPLLGYARTLCGGDRQAAEDLYYQARLDAHDYVQAKGHTGDDFRFLLLRIIARRHVDEHRRQEKHPALPAATLELADASPDVDERAHLAQLVAAYVQEEFEPADRVLLRLHVEGYSLRETQQLTGRNYKAVQRVLGSMFARVREVFGPMWEAL